jgi:hypothetical protein
VLRCAAVCSGAAQAAVIAYGLFIFSSKVTNIIANQDLPAGYTVSEVARVHLPINHSITWFSNKRKTQ